MEITFIKKGYCNFCNKEESLVEKEVLEFKRSGSGLMARICGECLEELNKNAENNILDK